MTYTKSESGLFLPTVSEIYIFIDDGGSEENNFFGFTALLLDNFSKLKLEENIKEFIELKSIKELHARDLKIKDIDKLEDMKIYEDIYTELFKLSSSIFKTANNFFLINILCTTNSLQYLYHLYYNRFGNIMDELRKNNVQELYKNFYSFITLPIYEVLRYVTDCDDAIKLYVMIDRKNDFDRIAEEKIIVPGKNQSLIYSLKSLSVRLLNMSLKLLLNNNAKITDLFIVDSKKK